MDKANFDNMSSEGKIAYIEGYSDGYKDGYSRFKNKISSDGDFYEINLGGEFEITWKTIVYAIFVGVIIFLLAQMLSVS